MSSLLKGGVPCLPVFLVSVFVPRLIFIYVVRVASSIEKLALGS